MSGVYGGLQTLINEHAQMPIMFIVLRTL
nr:unnamed protein product [Callosobruchus analis]